MIVSFDFGGTLCELDHEFLARRALERGERLDPERSLAAIPEGLRVYGAQKAKGHAEGWLSMMELVLERAGARSARELAEWLWTEQPTRNLWRKPIPGMFELAAELRARGVRLAILSNSEGHLAELVEELGLSRSFPIVVDSGRVGLDKPDPRIFELTAARLEGHTRELLHVGDSWEADVQGALGAGASAIWFGAGDERPLPERARHCRDAAELRATLAELGLV